MRQPEKAAYRGHPRAADVVPLLHLPLAAGAVLVLSTQLLEPLYTTHIQKQLTEQADTIVQKLDDAIADGQTLSYWGSAVSSMSTASF